MTVQVRFLGTGDAFNASAHCHASYLLTAPSGRILLDCGLTTLLAMKRDGIAVEDVDAIFVSHLHGDHFGGIPMLFLESVYEVPRSRPLTIVGPPGTARRIDDLWRALYREIAARPLPFALDCIEVHPGQATRAAGIDLLPFRVPHQENEISLGVRAVADGKSLLYSGDTGWTEDLVTQSKGTDLFICECTYFETRVDFHLDYPRLADNAPRFGCQRLILTHAGRQVLARRDELTQELAREGLVVEL